MVNNLQEEKKESMKFEYTRKLNTPIFEQTPVPYKYPDDLTDIKTDFNHLEK